jgi:hypothetical protein
MARSRGYCFYLYVFVFDLIFLVYFIYILTVLYSVSRNFSTPVSKIYITYYFCYFTINERLLLKYVYYKHDCLKIFECPGSTIDNIVASSMLIPVRVKPAFLQLCHGENNFHFEEMVKMHVCTKLTHRVRLLQC